MIIVLLDKDDQLTDFYSLDSIRTYKKKDGEFKIIKESKHIHKDITGIKSFRNYLDQLMDEFSESKLIIGSQITGVAFHYFVKAGFEICEADQLNEKLLEQVYQDYIKNPFKKQEESEKIPQQDTPIVPNELDKEGNYFLDFIRIQKNRPDISSKKALLPFLSQQAFNTLTVECSHIMPWLEDYIKLNHHLQYDYKREHGMYTVVISHN